MNRTRFSAVLLALLLGVTGAFAQATSWKDIQTPPLRKFAMPQPQRIQLGNGMVIFLQEDHELPLIRAAATIRGGARDVPAAKAGLIDIYSDAWRTGGTATRTGDELDQFLESRAAEVETGGDVDSTSVSMDVLKADFDTVFPIFLDLLRAPAFRQEKIDLAKTQVNTGISRRNDEPGGIISREAAKLGYGPGSPYVRQPEYATVASITRDDLLDFHKRTVHPNNVIFSVIGDFDAKKMEKTLRTAFGSWKRGPQVAKPDPAITPAKPGVYYIAKDDVTQANIAMVHPGIERSNPDYYALAVMNEIFSGGFSGRLMQRLRSEKGLTYGVGGGVGAAWDYPGLFRVQMATKSESALEAIDALQTEIRKLAGEPPTDAELSLAKESILNAFVFTMDTRAKALDQQVLLEFYGFPSNYYTLYPANIEKVSAQDVARVAAKYIHPDQLAVLVVGNEKDFGKPLSSLGTVTNVDIAIPELDSGEKKPAATASDAAGLALATKVLDFVGGKALVDSVQSIQRSGSMTVKTPQGDMQMDFVVVERYPDSMRATMKTPMGEIVRVVTPQAAFMVTPMGTQDIPSSQRDAALGEMKLELLQVLRNVGNPKYVFTAAGTEKAGGVDAAVLQVNADGSQSKWLVDTATGQLLQTVVRAGAPMPGDLVTTYADWKKFGNLNFPSKSTQSLNGETLGESVATAIELNPAVDASAFAKP